MGIDETGKDELAVEIDHLGARGCRRVRRQNIANHAAFDQEGASGERSIGYAVDDRGAADQDGGRRLRAARRQCANREHERNETDENNAPRSPFRPPPKQME